MNSLPKLLPLLLVIVFTAIFFYHNNNTLQPKIMTSPEVRHIGFLKVHKAGGSTIQNILFRFGFSRNLSMVIPKTSYRLSDYGKKPNPLLEPQRSSFDILAIHSVYDEYLYSKLLPRDAVNIAIVRDPLTLMISGAYYYRDVEKMTYLQHVPKENYIRNLIEYPEIYDRNVLSWTRNSMAMDFMFPNNLHVMDTKKINKYLGYLNKRFSLVMVMERFDESLILLKRLLKWQLKDILYVPINTHKHLAKELHNLSESLIGKFELRNFLDVEIYKYFSGIFTSRISNAGSSLADEVRHFRKVLAGVWNYCCSGENSDSLFVETSQWNERFVVDSGDCDLLFMKELDFIDLLRHKVLTNEVTVPKHSAKSKICMDLVT